ncbi:hypothetical protein K438DRAFT_1777381 [Mycena galopus ATCC 62051]|nr:hypothetical protein K438DRAFT_1777381 [Mycena galopus ATCC 62051]
MAVRCVDEDVRKNQCAWPLAIKALISVIQTGQGSSIRKVVPEWEVKQLGTETFVALSDVRGSAEAGITVYLLRHGGRWYIYFTLWVDAGIRIARSTEGCQEVLVWTNTMNHSGISGGRNIFGQMQLGSSQLTPFTPQNALSPGKKPVEPSRITVFPRYCTGAAHLVDTNELARLDSWPAVENTTALTQRLPPHPDDFMIMTPSLRVSDASGFYFVLKISISPLGGFILPVDSYPEPRCSLPARKKVCLLEHLIVVAAAAWCLGMPPRLTGGIRIAPYMNLIPGESGHARTPVENSPRSPHKHEAVSADRDEPSLFNSAWTVEEITSASMRSPDGSMPGLWLFHIKGDDIAHRQTPLRKEAGSQWLKRHGTKAIQGRARARRFPANPVVWYKTTATYDALQTPETSLLIIARFYDPVTNGDDDGDNRDIDNSVFTGRMSQGENDPRRVQQKSDPLFKI